MSLVLPDWDVKRVHVFQIPQDEDQRERTYRRNEDVTEKK